MTTGTNGAGKMKTDAIVYVEDSLEDQMIFEMALSEAGIQNKFIIFNDGTDALEYMKNTQDVPFIIVSDVNMPKMDGFKLKQEIEADEHLRILSVPFIFLSSSASRQDVKTAFYHQAQGYFEKPSDLNGLAQILKLIKQYWSVSQLPSVY